MNKIGTIYSCNHTFGELSYEFKNGMHCYTLGSYVLTSTEYFPILDVPGLMMGVDHEGRIHGKLCAIGVAVTRAKFKDLNGYFPTSPSPISMLKFILLSKKKKCKVTKAYEY